MNAKKTRAKNKAMPIAASKAGMKSHQQREAFFANKGVRETVESIVVAFILAFLFRTFEAEAFVIPTGSMAPTLQGRHKDVHCPECGFNYRAGASQENRDNPDRDLVIKCVCPSCGFVMDCLGKKRDNQHNRSEPTYNGDRILVSKFSYQFGEPKRWDVIVFKYPGNAKMNYIKRLVGLPNETIRIQYGDVFVADNFSGELSEFHIARKPPDKLLAMLQLVHDNQHCAKRLIDAGWPVRWQSESIPGLGDGDSWKSEWEVDKKLPTRAMQRWSFNGSDDEPLSWIRYRHFLAIIPHKNVWGELDKGAYSYSPTGILSKPYAIGDFYAYNESRTRLRPHSHNLNLNWVGDLAVGAHVNVQSESGHLLFELVEGGHAFTCDFDLETGLATLAIDGSQTGFVDEQNQPDNESRTTQTNMQRPGKYNIMFANIDDQLVLWINDTLVPFNRPTSYAPLNNHQATDEDLEPVGIGVRGAKLTVDQLQVLRDVYYIAADDRYASARNGIAENQNGVEFRMDADQFFVLGDNSPQSRDSRLWKTQYSTDEAHYVERDLLIGKAMFIYWPHTRSDIFPFCPNIPRMGFVR